MTLARIRQALACLIVQLTLAGSLGVVVLRDAHASELDALAGWWIAVDETWPKIWEGAGIPAMEELLIVDADGRVENRMMLFHTPDAQMCAAAGNCSDAPVVARARIVTTGGHLKFTDRVEGKAPIFFGETEPALNSRYRSLSATGRPSWAYTLQRNGRLLTLQAGKAALTRPFVAIEPDRLRRLRAGLIVADVAAFEHWRCFLANATADDPAFAAIREDKHSAPDFLDAFLKAASYGIALQDASRRPVPDDPDPALRELVEVPLERIMVEAFEDIRLPASSAERDVLQSRLAAFSARMRGDPVQMTFPIGDLEFAALMRATSPGDERKGLFCLE